MRLLLLGTATIALSGCSWLGIGGSKHHYSGSSNYGYKTSQPAGCCEGGKALSRWNLEAAAGPEFFVGGDAITGSKINPGPGVVAVDQSMEDIYDPGMRYELGGSYALSPNRKVTLMGSYAKAEGEQVNLGTFGGSALTGKMGDYERYGIEAGVRQYFMPKRAPLVKSIRPYVEAKVGAAKVKDIALENAMHNGAVFGGGTVGLYESSWVPTGAGLVGVEAPIFNRATLGLETGIRYSGHPKSDNTTLAPGFALAGTNNGASSWTVPVMLRGRYRF